MNTFTVYNRTEYSFPLAPGEYLIQIQPCTNTGCGRIRDHVVKVPKTKKWPVNDFGSIIDDQRMLLPPVRTPINDVFQILDSVVLVYREAALGVFNDLTHINSKVQFKHSLPLSPILDTSWLSDYCTFEITSPPETITIELNDIFASLELSDAITSRKLIGTDITPAYDYSDGGSRNYITLSEVDRTKLIETIWIPGCMDFSAVDRTEFVGIGKQHDLLMIVHTEYATPHDTAKQPDIIYTDTRDYVNFEHNQITVADTITI
jgi:hypothetical protein